MDLFQDLGQAREGSRRGCSPIDSIGTRSTFSTMRATRSVIASKPPLAVGSTG
jgi:hypothetical protein